MEKPITFDYSPYEALARPHARVLAHVFSWEAMPPKIQNFLADVIFGAELLCNDTFVLYTVHNERLDRLAKDDPWRVAKTAVDAYFTQYLPPYGSDEEGPTILIWVSW